MLRIAIAGTGGLAQYIADCLAKETPHQYILISRAYKPDLTAQGHQVLVVDYTDPTRLMYALTGIDTVISTVSGTSQLALIEAAVRCGCRRFVPSEFSGPPARRPLGDAIESAKTETLDRLRYYAGQIESTVFVCGIFYERFAPGGMGALGLGLGRGISGEGDYVLDMRNFHAEIPSHDREGREVHVSMTSAQDVARFVVRALDFAHWPLELWMQGDRMSVWNLVMEAEAIRGRPFEKVMHNPVTLQHALTLAATSRDWTQVLRVQNLIATCENRYDFVNPLLNNMVEFAPVGFALWLKQAWENIE